MTAMTVQLAALTAAMMAGQRASAEVRTQSPRPSPPWTAATPSAAPAAPPAPPTPAPPPPPTPAAPPPTTPAAQPTPTPPAAEPLYELSAPDFCAARAHEHRFLAIKSLTPSITKALKVKLDPVTMDTDLEALLNLLRTHDTNMPFYLDMSPEVRATLLAEGGALAEWLQATDLAVANGVHASLDKDSDNVKNVYSKYSGNRALCSSGRALLAHFKDMFNVITGFALLQAERTMRDLVPFTTGMAAAKAITNEYQMLSLQKRLPAARHLDGVGLLQAQLQLLLDKLPDSQPDKMELIRKALQDESQGVMTWSSMHDMLDATAIWLTPSHELSLTRVAPVANAAAAPGKFGSRPPGRGCWICASITCSSLTLTCPHRCHTGKDKLCPGANLAKPPTPCLVHAPSRPDAETTKNALGDRLPHSIFMGLVRRWESRQASAPVAAHAGELSEAEIAEIEFGIEQRAFTSSTTPTKPTRPSTCAIARSSISTTSAPPPTTSAPPTTAPSPTGPRPGPTPALPPSAAPSRTISGEPLRGLQAGGG